MNNMTVRIGKPEVTHALADSPDVLKLIITNIPQIMFWKDTKSVFMGCNPAFTKVSGVKLADIIGKTDFDLISKEQAVHMQEIDQKIIAGSLNLYTGSEKITKPNGEDIWVDLTLVPLYNQDGAVMGVLGSAENITEKLSLIDKLKHSEEKYKNLINFTNTGYVIMDDKLGIIETNQIFVNIIGIHHDDVICQNPRAWVDHKDVQKFDDAFNSLLRFERKFINDLEIGFINANDQSLSPTAVTANIIENGDRKIFCLVRDISERKIEEQRKYITDQKSRDRIKQNITELRQRLKEIQFK